MNLQRMHKPLAWLLILSATSAVMAKEDDTQVDAPPVNDGQHLLQLGYTSVDGFDGDVACLLSGRVDWWLGGLLSWCLGFLVSWWLCGFMTMYHSCWMVWRLGTVVLVA